MLSPWFFQSNGAQSDLYEKFLLRILQLSRLNVCMYVFLLSEAEGFTDLSSNMYMCLFIF